MRIPGLAIPGGAGIKEHLPVVHAQHAMGLSGLQARGYPHIHRSRRDVSQGWGLPSLQMADINAGHGTLGGRGGEG
jgi:hypothetical protein